MNMPARASVSDDAMTMIGFLQYEVQFADTQQNIQRVQSLLQDQPAADLLVLPELAFSGYDFDTADQLKALAEPCGDGPVSEFLRQLSVQTGATIVAGYAERSGNALFNSAMIAADGAIIGNYRKIHLYNRENELFTPGDAPPSVVETPAGRVGTMICFDWFFPEVARSLALQGAQVIVHPSNLVLPWCQRAMFARSVENHVYTVTANRVGTEERSGRKLTFTGGSQVVGPDGALLAHAGTTEECVGLVDVDLHLADDKQINSYNHLLDSRREDMYGALLSRRD